MKANLESKISTPPLESQRALMEHLALFELIEELIEIIEKQQQEIAELRLEVKRLWDQFYLDSHNSRYLPSTDKSKELFRKHFMNSLLIILLLWSETSSHCRYDIILPPL